jgi:hypothetical protein
MANFMRVELSGSGGKVQAGNGSDMNKQCFNQKRINDALAGTGVVTNRVVFPLGLCA